MFFKQSLWIVLFIAVGLTSTATQYSISGTIKNSEGEPEAYATLRLYNLTDTIKPAILGTSADNGMFSLAPETAGNYRLVISATGKRDFRTDIDLSKENHKIFLDNITLADMTMDLGAVEVVAQRPLVSKEIDRIGYDVQADNESKTSTVQEILRKVPMVSVDPDGTIKVNGSSDFKIYKNGRPNNNFTRNAKDVFRAIPASTIKKIEVITDPGAREDAEGSNAILNIVTLQGTSIKGVMGSVGLNTSTSNFVPSPYAMIMTQVDKVTLSLNGGLYNMSSRDYKGRSESTSFYEESRNTLYTSSYNDRNKSSGNHGWFSIEGSYDIDTLNLLTVEVSSFFYNGKTPTFGSTTMTDENNQTLYSFDTHTTRNNMNYLSLDGSINYQHSTKRQGETVTLSYLISNNHNSSDSQLEYYNVVNPFFDYTGINSDNTEDFMEHTGQLDWTRPINDRHKFDIGAKFIFRNNHSDGNRYYTGENEHETPTDYIHRTSIGAAYFDWRSKLGKVTLRGGLRYEFSRLTSKDRLDSDNNYSSNLNDWVPMAAINYSINDAQSIKLSYNTRISRPGISTLNPTRVVTPTFIRYGNPDLSSSMNHTFSLNYNIIKRRFNADLTLSYNFSNDGVNAMEWVDNDITYSTYGNIGQNRSVNLGGYMRWMITNTTSWMLNMGINHNTYIYPGSDLKLSKWGGHYYTQLQQKLPGRLDLQLWNHAFIGGARSVYNYSELCSGNIRYGISVSRSFLKEDRLQTRLTVQNPFGQYTTKSISRNVNSGVDGKSTYYHYNATVVSLAVSYRFGSLNAYVKKASRAASNDDLSKNRPSTGN